MERDLHQETRLAWKAFFEEQSRKERERDRYLGVEDYERAEKKRHGYRNGFYLRDFVTRMGTLRLRIARARHRSFLPPGLERFRRRTEEVMMLIREVFLGGHLDAAGGAGGSDADGRSGERADGLEAEPESGPAGESLSAGAARRRVGVLVSGRCEPAGTAAGGSETRANAGRLRGAGRWKPATVGLSAQPGRDPGGRKLRSRARRVFP